MTENQLDLFRLLAPSIKEDPQKVIADVTHTCTDCRLGAVFHPHNPGMVWRGSLTAKIGVVSEAPGDEEMISRLPLVGKSGQMWERWAAYAQLDTKTGCFITNVIQCQPDKEKDKSGRYSQRTPMDDEIRACFGPRCLRVLRAMPNLEVIITLGWVAARTILGGEPNSKTHENKWFTTSLLPGVAVFCMVHPSYLVREPTQEKSERVKKGLDYFRREYTLLKKIKPIVQQMEADDQQQRDQDPSAVG